MKFFFSVFSIYLFIYFFTLSFAIPKRNINLSTDLITQLPRSFLFNRLNTTFLSCGIETASYQIVCIVHRKFLLKPTRLRLLLLLKYLLLKFSGCNGKKKNQPCLVRLNQRCRFILRKETHTKKKEGLCELQQKHTFTSIFQTCLNFNILRDEKQQQRNHRHLLALRSCHMNI